MTPLDVFGGVMYLLFFAPFLFPLAPWFAKRPRGAWLVCCAAVSVLVLLFPTMFWWGCDWSNCGQGAVAIFILAPSLAALCRDHAAFRLGGGAQTCTHADIRPAPVRSLTGRRYEVSASAPLICRASAAGPRARK